MAKNGQDFRNKFVRLRDQFYMTNPDKEGASHESLLVEHGIKAEVLQLMTEKSKDVDAGLYGVQFYPTLQLMMFVSGSGSYNLPVEEVAEEARAITGELAQKKFPNFDVETSV